MRTGIIQTFEVHIPPIVFRVKEEVSADDCDANGNRREDQKDQKHESINVVYLIRPERGEDEVHLDKYGSER